MFCAKCGQQNEDRAQYCQSCGNVFQAKAAIAVSDGTYAGFWERVVAALIDCVVLVVGSIVLSIVSFGAFTVAGFVVAWLYEALTLSSQWQATPGKRAMNIIVTGIDGGRITFARATARHFAKYISTFILFIGYIMAAFTEKKQALHDMMAETLVIHGKR